MGSGSVFCCASSATCSTLTSVDIKSVREEKEGGKGACKVKILPEKRMHRSLTYLCPSVRAQPVQAQRKTRALIRGAVCSRCSRSLNRDKPVKTTYQSHEDRGVGTRERTRMRMTQWERGVCCVRWRTLSTVAAGNEDVDKTRDSELTDVSLELVGSTAPNDC